MRRRIFTVEIPVTVPEGMEHWYLIGKNDPEQTDWYFIHFNEFTGIPDDRRHPLRSLDYQAWLKQADDAVELGRADAGLADDPPESKAANN